MLRYIFVWKNNIYGTQTGMFIAIVLIVKKLDKLFVLQLFNNTIIQKI